MLSHPLSQWYALVVICFGVHQLSGSPENTEHKIRITNATPALNQSNPNFLLCSNPIFRISCRWLQGKAIGIHYAGRAGRKNDVNSWQSQSLLYRSRNCRAWEINELSMDHKTQLSHSIPSLPLRPHCTSYLELLSPLTWKALRPRKNWREIGSKKLLKALSNQRFKDPNVRNPENTDHCTHKASFCWN